MISWIRKKVCLLTLLDLSAAFDTIDHTILVKRLETTLGVSGTALRWFKSYLDNRYQSVRVGTETSDKSLLRFGVPQGSVLGPVLFTLYTQPLADIIKKHRLNYHFYADDTQLYISGDIDELPVLISKISTCVLDIKEWMTMNKLKLNDDKTEFMILGSNDTLSNVPTMTLPLGEHDIAGVGKVRNLGAILDCHMTMDNFVGDTCKKMYHQIRKIGSVRPFLTEDVTKTLVTSLVLSRLDFCNSLLGGLQQNSLHRLQIAQNQAARLVKRTRKRDHITPILKELHWLPVNQRIAYKICLLTFKGLNGLAPAYISNQLCLYKPTRSLRSMHDTTPACRRCKTLGERSLSLLAPTLWNQLLQAIR